MEDAGTFDCRICHNSAGNKAFRTREMMYGLREEFDYIECASCGCVQIREIPADLGKYYPSDYFSFRSYERFSRNLVRRLIDPLRVRHCFGTPNLVGRIAEAVSQPLTYVEWLKRAGLGPDARVLDVGCGGGKTLVAMALGGIQTCHGVDPYISAPQLYDVGATVWRMSLADFAATTDRAYDLVMFHHSFEHVVDPLADLQAAVQVLAPRGVVLIEIPVAAYAWEQYRGDWCHLDPPRHLHLFTPRSLGHLGGHVGLRVKATVNHSNWGQFLGSERNRRDIAEHEPHDIRRLLSAAKLREFKELTARLNAEGRGDIMTFYLDRVP